MSDSTPLFFYGDTAMKLMIPMLAVCCFAFAGVGCKSTSCCGKCGGDKAHSHSDAKTCPANCTKPCCAKKE